jgi:DNA modification methylase
MYKILQGDCIDVLKTLPERSVHCVVTSPPYWGLRNYGTATWEGGDPDCDHASAKLKSRYDYALQPEAKQLSGDTGTDAPRYKEICPTCGARKFDEQIGLEPTFEEFIEKMLEVFRGVWQVLRDDGTLWLNLGDSYAGNSSAGNKVFGNPEFNINRPSRAATKTPKCVPVGLKPKDLVGIPWRVALALQADGWYLRSDIIWSKPNPMPESVTDRPTKAHEYMFLLSKQERYFYDSEAIKENQTQSTLERAAYGWHGRTDDGSNGARTGSTFKRMAASDEPIGTIPADGKRNRRTVWTIPTSPYSGAHFATFPPKLVEPCILAGTSVRGCCPLCGAPWKRMVKKTGGTTGKSWHDHKNDLEQGMSQKHLDLTAENAEGEPYRVTTVGFQPTCACNLDPVPCTVLDPFSGAGTTGLVALQHNRNYIGIELNPAYVTMSQERLDLVQPLLVPT